MTPKVKQFKSIREAYDDLFNWACKEDLYYHTAYRKIDPSKLVNVLHHYVAALNNYPFSLSEWAFFKASVYQRYGWKENEFITNFVKWPGKIKEGKLKFSIDLDWQKLQAPGLSPENRAMLCYIVWFMLANGEFMQNDQEIQEKYNIHKLVPRYQECTYQLNKRD
jgi:hypothetical protein